MLTSKALSGFILSKMGDGLSPNTEQIYRWALDKLIDYTHDSDVENITTDVLRSWLTWLRDGYTMPSGGRLSAASRQDAWTAVKSFCRWAHDTMGIPNAADGLKRPPGESPVIVPFSEDDVKALLKAAGTITTKDDKRKSYTMRAPNDKRNTAIMLTLLDCGLRVGELCRLNCADVDLSTGAVNIAPFGSGRKTKARQVHLGKVASRAIWLYLSSRTDTDDAKSPLFVTDELRRMTEGGIYLLLRRIGKRAGVPDVFCHRFRHTFAVQYLRNGGDVFTLQRLLGHSSLAMVHKYLALADADDAEAHRRASPADKWRL